MNIYSLKKLKIPDKPGVYLFLKGRDILYIGKATSLRDRIKSYFGKDLIETRGPLIIDLVFKADKIKWEETDSVLEALILEASLIKRYQPKYNTKEKSDKSFNYVCITKETLPKVLIVRERNIKGIGLKFQAKYGPFTNGTQLKEAMKIIRPIFPFIDIQSFKHDNFEFYRQLGLTPDISNENLQIAYKKNISNLKLFFEGKKKRIISNLKKEMITFAKSKEFERAEDIKRKIFALSHINDVALIKDNNSFVDNKVFNPAPFFGRRRRNKVGPSDKKTLLATSQFRMEAYDIAHMAGKNMVGVMVVIENGETEKSEYKKFKIRTQTDANDIGALKEVLERRLAHLEWLYPGLIVVDGGIAQINTAKALLIKMGLKIEVVSVLKDEHHKPKDILGDREIILKYRRDILLANNEAHRFAISYHKSMRNKNFLK